MEPALGFLCSVRGASLYYVFIFFFRLQGETSGEEDEEVMTF